MRPCSAVFVHGCVSSPLPRCFQLQYQLDLRPPEPSPVQEQLQLLAALSNSHSFPTLNSSSQRGGHTASTTSLPRIAGPETHAPNSATGSTWRRSGPQARSGKQRRGGKARRGKDKAHGVGPRRGAITKESELGSSLESSSSSPLRTTNPRPSPDAFMAQSHRPRVRRPREIEALHKTAPSAARSKPRRRVGHTRRLPAIRAKRAVRRDHLAQRSSEDDVGSGGGQAGINTKRSPPRKKKEEEPVPLWGKRELAKKRDLTVKSMMAAYKTGVPLPPPLPVPGRKKRRGKKKRSKRRSMSPSRSPLREGLRDEARQ